VHAQVGLMVGLRQRGPTSTRTGIRRLRRRLMDDSFRGE